ncbi:hypothetical protein [Halobiforma nitratireducens]|uniref:Uncharacterized protein n=1 Tax=Halobiforma nitratireducens JCM 10879 TaxID=1227454 RepID=M0M3I6_9EURY|nr:hypothetical protein [Halobiforma nitratireducens]EMA39169.1 hypothetical protein C446_08871 [Halobiforma nitratireducens JCM 10879]
MELSKPVISERCDVSEEIIKKHYDERSAADRRELQRELFEKTRTEKNGATTGYIYLPVWKECERSVESLYELNPTFARMDDRQGASASESIFGGEPATTDSV